MPAGLFPSAPRLSGCKIDFGLMGAVHGHTVEVPALWEQQIQRIWSQSPDGRLFRLWTSFSRSHAATGTGVDASAAGRVEQAAEVETGVVRAAVSRA
jgi:hypothetical protein